MTDAFETAKAIALRARELGGRAMIVGGWVRDSLLKLDPKDVDVEVYGISEDMLPGMLEPFGRVSAVGRAFGVYKVVPPGGGELDVFIPRRDNLRDQNNRIGIVAGDPHMTVTEAARRRDFTINALSFDPLTGAYEDPFNGREDLLERRILKAVDHSTFGDDSLRVLRAVQFAARFNLALDPGTAELCQSIPLDDLPAERIWGEIEKLLLKAPQPSIGMKVARDLGVIERLFPEVQRLIGCSQDPEWHPEGDVWIHTLMVMDCAVDECRDLDRPRRLAVMLGALCHDLGKPPTTKEDSDGRIRSLRHEEAGVEPTNALLDRLNVHHLDGYDVRKQTIGLVANHLKPGMFFKTRLEVTDGAFRKLAKKVDMDLLARVARADCRGRTGSFDCSGMDWFIERARKLGVEHGQPRQLLFGRHLIELGVEPGPRMGQIEKRVYELQLDGAVTNLEEAIAAAREILAENGPAG